MGVARQVTQGLFTPTQVSCFHKRLTLSKCTPRITYVEPTVEGAFIDVCFGPNASVKVRGNFLSWSGRAKEEVSREVGTHQCLYSVIHITRHPPIEHASYVLVYLFRLYRVPIKLIRDIQDQCVKCAFFLIIILYMVMLHKVQIKLHLFEAFDENEKVICLHFIKCLQNTSDSLFLTELKCSGLNQYFPIPLILQLFSRRYLSQNLEFPRSWFDFQYIRICSK